MASNAQDLDNFDPVAVAANNGKATVTVRPVLRTDVWTRFRCYIWDNDSHLKSAAERKLLRKLDGAMLTCLCLGFFCKYLDQSNLANAYVSGMKEDLGWKGNQYTYAKSLYTAAYAIMQIPSTLIVQKVRPSYWLAFCEIAWASFTFAQAGAHNTNTMYALRFMVGMTESAFFPVGLYLLGSWYTPSELAKRTAIFHFTAPAGTAFSGYMQAAVYKTLNNHGGLEGWRWLYIICGIITFPCGCLILFVLPNYPSSPKRWYLTEEEHELAQERMRRIKRAQSDGKLLSLPVLKRIFSNWHVYLLPLTYIFYGMSCGGGGYFSVYLKSTHKYSVEMVNILPTFGNVIEAFTTILWGFLSDYTGSRFWFTFGPLAYGAIPCGILAVWPSNYKLKQFAFMTLGMQLMTAVIYTWWSEICSADPLERGELSSVLPVSAYALVISMSNGLQFATSAWLPLVIFRQTDSPTFRKGFPADFAFVIVGLILLVLVKFLHARDLRRQTVLEPSEEEVYGNPQRDSLEKKQLDIDEAADQPAAVTLTGKQ